MVAVRDAKATIRSGRRGRPSVLITSGLLTAALAMAGGWLWLKKSDLETARHAVVAGDRHTAWTSYETHLANAPDDFSARLELAQLLLPIDPGTARQHLNRVPNTADEHAEALLLTAQTYLQSADFSAAERVLHKLVFEYPKNTNALWLLGDTQFRQRRYPQALSNLERYLEQQPRDIQAHLLLAETLDELKRPADMIQPLQKVLDLNSEQYAAHANLAHAYRMAGEPDAAQKHVQWCLERQPRDVGLLRQHASILMEKGESQQALQVIQNAIRLDPADVPCRSLEANLLLFLQRPQEAYTSLKQVYAIASSQRSYLAQLARAAALSGRTVEARELQAVVRGMIRAMDQAERE